MLGTHRRSHNWQIYLKGTSPLLSRIKHTSGPLGYVCHARSGAWPECNTILVVGLEWEAGRDAAFILQGSVHEESLWRWPCSMMQQLHAAGLI